MELGCNYNYTIYSYETVEICQKIKQISKCICEKLNDSFSGAESVNKWELLQGLPNALPAVRYSIINNPSL